MNSFEQRILTKVDLERDALRAKRREEIVSILSNRFDFDSGKIDSQLVGTKYSDVWSTGNVYWWLRYPGRLVWLKRVESDQHYELFGSGINELARYLRRQQRWKL